MENNKEVATVSIASTTIPNKEIVDIANKLIEDCIESTNETNNQCQVKEETINQQNESPINEIEIQVIEQKQVNEVKELGEQENNKKDELETQEVKINDSSDDVVVTPKETTAANSSSEDEAKPTTTTSEQAPSDTTNTQTSSDTTSTTTNDDKTKIKQKKTKKEKKSKDLDSTSNSGKLIEGEVKRKESIGVKIKRVFTLGKSESKKKAAIETQPSANGTCHANGNVNGNVVASEIKKEEEEVENKPVEVVAEVSEVEAKIKDDDTKTETTIEVVSANKVDKTTPAAVQVVTDEATPATTVNNETATLANDKLGKHSNQNCIII